MYEHMITYMIYGHEATKTCQVQPRNKTMRTGDADLRFYITTVQDG